MDLPTVADVNEQRVVRFRNRITEALADGGAEPFRSLIEEYEREGQAIKEKAAALEKSAAAHARAAEIKLAQNDRYDLSVALLQIAIAMVSLTVLVRRVWILAIGVLVGLGGAAAGVTALLMTAAG